MHRFLLAIAVLILPGTGQAQQFDYCEQLWVSRNMMFDRAGYCFGSALGQSLFDNSNCTSTTPPALHPELQDIAAWVRDDEGRIGCGLNTAQPAWPSIRAVFDYYNQFWTVPAPVDGGYACWGYTGPTVPVHAGADTNTPRLGEMRSGLSYVTTHYGVTGWIFITVSTGPGGQDVVTGWAPNAGFSGQTCAQEAG